MQKNNLNFIKNKILFSIKHFSVFIFLLFLTRKIIFKQLAYADFVPFFQDLKYSFRNLISVWNNDFTGFFLSTNYASIVRIFFEFISFDNPILAQNFYIIFFLLTAYYGFYFLFKKFKINYFLNYLIPFFYIINPAFLGLMSNGSMGTLIVYSLFPFLFLLFYDLFLKYSFKKAFIFSIIVPFFLIVPQLAFWFLIVLLFFIIINFLFERVNIKNLFLLGVHFFLGFLLSLVSFFSFLIISRNTDNFSYLETFKHTYSQTNFYNLFRFVGNNGSSQSFFGYFNFDILNLLPFLIFIIIIICFVFFKKQEKKDKIIIYFFLMFIILGIMFLMFLIRCNYFDKLIIDKNLLIISLRNPEKLFFPFSFSYVFLLGLCLNLLLSLLKNKINYTKSILLILLVSSIFLFQNKYFLNGDFGLEKLRGEYFFMEEKYQKFFDITKNMNIDNNSYVLFLPFDYSTQLRTLYENKLIKTRMGLIDDRNKVIGRLYNEICAAKNPKIFLDLLNKNINLKYVVLDKNAKNYYNKEMVDCIPYSIYGSNYIWGSYSYFSNLFSRFNIYYEDNDFKILEINNNSVPYIKGINGLFQFQDFNNLEEKYTFINDYLGNDFDFVIKEEEKNSNNLTCLYGLFNEINNKEINQEKLLISDNINISQDKINNFYNSQTAQEIFYRKYNNEIFVYTKTAGDLFLNNQNINVFKTQEKILARQIIDLNKQYYFKINNQIIKADNYTGLIGKIEQNNVLEIYSLDDNLINNYSFEDGTWTEKVGDCHNYDDNRILAMSLNTKVKSDGNQSLQLEATRHIACTNQRFKVEPGEYVFSFDYQSNNAPKAGFNLSFNDNKTVFKDSLVIDNNEWQSHNQLIAVPDGANLARLHIYAYESDKSKNNIVRYDNFSFAKLNLEKAVTVNKSKDDYKKIEIDLNQEENIFEYQETGYDYKNQILNGSFENGAWTEKVGDCNNYDDNRILAMSLNTNIKSDGNQSLQLEATRHIACTSIGQSIKSGSNYLFSFDYQSDNAKQAGYYLGFNDSEKTKISEKIDIENSGWKTIEKNIKVPEGATKMSIYVYAYESDGKTNNIVRYDNFKLIELPDLTDRFYLVSEPKEKLNEPKETNFDLINPTKKLIHIKGATTPFFLAMSESYHVQWELQMNNERIQGILNSWWPFAKRQKVNDEYHYKLANFLNAWYVDVPELCKNSNKACTKNEDGSYDIEMVAEFWPQRWFYLGLLISGTTLIGCVGYLGYDFIRERKKRKKEKVK